jgi:hypothetical protein
MIKEGNMALGNMKLKSKVMWGIGVPLFLLVVFGSINMMSIKCLGGNRKTG